LASRDGKLTSVQPCWGLIYNLKTHFLGHPIPNFQV
jgi:hypothetical protein